MANKLLTLFIVLSGLVFVVSLEEVNQCLVCTTSANEQCRDPMAGQFLAECSAPNPGCFSRIVGENINRGCLNTWSTNDVVSCDSTVCFICEANGCNKQSFVQTTPAPNMRLLCHQCVSQEDSSCAENIVSAPTNCPNNVVSDQCYIARPGGNYERGCISSTKRCERESCQKCSTNGCNSGEYNSANDIYSMSKFFTITLLSVVIIVMNK